jgi:hypothetical protein
LRRLDPLDWQRELLAYVIETGCGLTPWFGGESARDHHIEGARSLYSLAGSLIGHRVEVRADRQLVRIFARGQLVKVHPRQAPGGPSTDPYDLPSEKTAYALRDLDRLGRMAAGHGEATGAYA